LHREEVECKTLVKICVIVHAKQQPALTWIEGQLLLSAPLRNSAQIKRLSIDPEIRR